MRRAVLVIIACCLFAPPAGAWFISHSNNQLDPAASPEQFRPAADGSRPTVGNPPAPLRVELLPPDPRLDDRIPAAARRAARRWNLEGSALVVTLEEVGKGIDPGWESRYLTADGRNTIEFVTEGWPFFWGPNAIAMTYPHLGPDGRIIDADIFCNAVDYVWTVLPEAGADPQAPPGKRVVDIEHVLTHEMGHMVGLGHSQRPWACMYANPGIRSTRARYLTDDDRAGVRFLYPATAADQPPADYWGYIYDVFGADPCSASSMTLLSALYLYVDRTIPLPGPHDLIRPPAWPSPAHICLFGAGIRDQAATAGVLQGLTLAAAAADASAIGSNFFRFSMDDGSSVFPVLPEGVYDYFVNQADGGTGILFQGLFVAAAGNEFPEAVLVARSLAAVGGSVLLDASGSFDPEGSPLIYSYELIEAPAAARLTAAGDQARLSLPAPGIYVVRLVVNDGTIDSIADLAYIQAAFFPAGDGDTDATFSCAAMPSGVEGGLNVLAAALVPLAFIFFIGKAQRKAQDR